MTKVLLIQNSISSYRVPVYNLISKNVDLTVLYSEGKVPDGICFKSLFVPVQRRGMFYKHAQSLRSIAKKYDVVIGMISFNWISNYLLAYGRRNYKFIPWGIGVPASYSVKFDDPSKKMNVFLTKQLIKHSDAVVFYTDYPKEKYGRMGLDKGQMFVAHNTVEVLPSSDSENKESVLFVGTLYKAKSTLPMMEIYKRAYEKNKNIPKLVLIGKGDEFEDLKKWVATNEMTHKVSLEGAIYDETLLKGYFEKALICVSLGQAGLSVQKSMGYGVPFVTTENSFTGGERLDIVSGENGVLLKQEDDFEGLLLDVANNPQTYLEMGKKAKDFYYGHRTIQMMADAVLSAIKYVK